MRARLSTAFAALLLAHATRAQQAPSVAEIPAHNRADLREGPPRPASEDANQRARSLFDAIVHDDPARASDFFFPRGAFLLVKDMRDPGSYYDRLHGRFERDIHELHAKLKDLDRASFDHLEVVRRGGWIKVGEEGNRLPYWASRHCWLHYRVGSELRRIEVRVLISWDDRWYVIHLSEFH